ncbi:hypothetical protein M406DRAFT_66255 [Cryphonectria parasitica EP155]|uniref:Uncharacterized protein n=1 Tax=Cryphonectria parasitica (strain ATCC 38755 / EP155) TaxID=660469 RepID=A0A9P5CSZ3_CRYP1|nr:uncharacterized protein M406DRAFT_66255 [Cryphonectria parasitica EP155]KAF3769788.1 hypothetical protein M406DRAFT_66255 [Cryphonectria parasitica EP155]
MAQSKVDSQFIHEVTKKENELTGQPDPVKGGPTAQAQKHVGENVDGGVVSDITKGEAKVTQMGDIIAGGPAAFAESVAAKAVGNQAQTTSSTQQDVKSGVLDSQTISRITHAESELTGQTEPVKGGPTAQAQKHTGETINSQNLHDITEGEKKVTGGERVKGGPTSTAQSELAKSRS